MQELTRFKTESPFQELHQREQHGAELGLDVGGLLKLVHGFEQVLHNLKPLLVLSDLVSNIVGWLDLSDYLASNDVEPMCS